MDSPNRAGATYVERAARSSLEGDYLDRHARLAGAGRFLAVLGEGGMGAVLLVEAVHARERSAGWLRRLALKLLKRSLVHDPEAGERLRRELASHERLSRELQVPRLVPCLGFQDDPDPSAVYGLFPYYPEGTLADLLSRRPGWAEAIWVLADAVEGLQSLHGHGYVHRDVHPSNIFVEREGRRRRGVLGDLGVGTFLERNTLVSGEEIDRVRELRTGHRGYIDPWSAATPAADLFAVGATLYRILVGQDPEEPRRAEPLRLPGRLPGPRLVRQARELADETLARLTSSDPGERYPNASEARAALARLAEALEESERWVVRRVAGRPAGRSRAWVLSVALVVAAAAVPVASGAYRWVATELSAGVTAPSPPERVEVVGSAPASHAKAAPAETPSLPPNREESNPAAPPPDSPPLSLPPSSVETPWAVAPVRPSRSAPAWRALADETLRSGEVGRALEMLEAGLAEHPDDAELVVRFALAAAGGAPARAARGRERLAAALEREPGRGDLRLALARLRLDAGDADGAWRALAAAPEPTSFGREIAALRVTLAAAADRDE